MGLMIDLEALDQALAELPTLLRSYAGQHCQFDQKQYELLLRSALTMERARQALTGIEVPALNPRRKSRPTRKPAR